MVLETMTHLSPDVFELQDPYSVGCGLPNISLLESFTMNSSLEVS